MGYKIPIFKEKYEAKLGGRDRKVQTKNTFPGMGMEIF